MRLVFIFKLAKVELLLYLWHGHSKRLSSVEVPIGAGKIKRFMDSFCEIILDDTLPITEDFIWRGHIAGGIWLKVKLELVLCEV
jgi:hypothetical protein